MFVHLQEEPLIPPVVLGQASRNFTRPVVSESEAVHLRLHRGNVLKRPLPRRRVVLDRRILGGQSERIPSHGMQHVVAVHPHVARQSVADRVIADVSHVQRARRVGKHLQHVVLRLSRIGFRGIERRIALPAVKPLLLDALRVVTLVAGGGDGLVGLGHRKVSTCRQKRLFYNGNVRPLVTDTHPCDAQPRRPSR